MKRSAQSLEVMILSRSSQNTTTSSVLILSDLFTCVRHCRLIFDKLALSLRDGELCYISFEDALSRWSVISQIPMILILGTTGESGFYKTRFGSIEFVHVPHSRELILSNTTEPYYAIRLAKKFFAFEDLKRIDRNMHLIDYEELYCDD